MNKLILMIAMMIASTQAQAFMSKTAMATDEVTPVSLASYQMDTVKIGQGSYLLPPTAQVASASIQIDQVMNVLHLTMQRQDNCPENAICTMQMPIPLTISLPITYVGSPFCGGSVLIAEGSFATVDGGSSLKVQMMDEGNNCQSNADDTTFMKRIQATITEISPKAQEKIISQMSGFPEQF